MLSIIRELFIIEKHRTRIVLWRPSSPCYNGGAYSSLSNCFPGQIVVLTYAYLSLVLLFRKNEGKQNSHVKNFFLKCSSPNLFALSWLFSSQVFPFWIVDLLKENNQTNKTCFIFYAGYHKYQSLIVKWYLYASLSSLYHLLC